MFATAAGPLPRRLDESIIAPEHAAAFIRRRDSGRGCELGQTDLATPENRKHVA
jgi:hypothetical protein